MLRTCQQCGTGFAPSIRFCPACGSEAGPTEEEQFAYGVQQAVQAVENGATIAEVREQLLADVQIPEQSVDDLVREAEQHLKVKSKIHGRKIAGSGCLLILITFGIFLVTGGFLITTFAAVLGILMLLAGSVKAWTGWNLTGRDFS